MQLTSPHQMLVWSLAPAVGSEDCPAEGKVYVIRRVLAPLVGGGCSLEGVKFAFELTTKSDVQ